jgi:tripartite-type tricarboxylate transporter receptor subunit TctC
MRMLAALVALVLSAAPSFAQSYPNKPVRVVVGFAAGGPTDVVARIVSQKLSESLGQQFYVENIGGAGSNTASGMVAKATPDGYTLLAISTGFMVNMSLYAKIPYDALKDFAPVTLICYSPNVVSVHPSVPAKTVPELRDLIKANPGKYSFAGPGTGSTPHLSGELFRLTYNLDFPHVPFTGAGPAIQSTLGGHTPVAFSALPPVVPAAKDGKLRVLGVAAEKRVPALPDVPTFAEQGITGQDADTLTGLVAPAGTPKEIVDLLQREIARIVALPDVKQKLDALGFITVANKPEEFAVRIKSEIEKWGKVVRDAKLRVE